MSNSIIFGADGWRGIIDQEFSNKNLATIAQAFSDYLCYNIHGIISPKVLVGFDNRKGSAEFANLFARVLAGNNISAYVTATLVPIPALSYYVKKHRFDAGVMITAGHLTANFNGIKFKGRSGGSLYDEDVKRIEEFLSQNLIQSGKDILTVDILPDYFLQLESLIDFRRIKKSKLNILIDSMSGAGGIILETLLVKHSINCKTIFEIPDPNFSGRFPDPVSENLLPLKEELLKKEFDWSLAIATDGDCDRLGILLDNGNSMSSQETILLLADYIISETDHLGNIAKTCSVTDKLFSIAKPGVEIIETPVGFKYLCEKMLNENCILGFDGSGGYGFRDHLPEPDAILSALLLMEMLADSNYKHLSEYLKDKIDLYGNIFYEKINFNQATEGVRPLLEKFNQEYVSVFGEFPIISKTDYFDKNKLLIGFKIKFQGDSRWITLRKSDNEKYIRLYVEADSSELLDKFIELSKGILESTGL